MAKILSIFGLAGTMLVMVLTPALAFDLIYTDDFAPVTEEGIFGVKVFPVYYWASAAFDADGEKQDFSGDMSMNLIIVPVELAYGVVQNLEIAVQPKFVRYATNSVMVGLNQTEDFSGSGIGDTWIKAKYAYPLENGALVAGRLAAKLPTGNDEPDEGDLETGEGQIDIDIGAVLNYPVEEFDINVALGYRVRMEQTDIESSGPDSLFKAGDSSTYDYKPGNEFHLMAEFGYHVNDETVVSLGIDGYFGSDDEYDGETMEESARSEVAIGPGVVYQVNETVAVKGDIFYEMFGKNTMAAGMGLNLGVMATF